MDPGRPSSRRGRRGAAAVAALAVGLGIGGVVTHPALVLGPGGELVLPTLLEPKVVEAAPTSYTASEPVAKRLAPTEVPTAVAGLSTYAYGPDPAQRLDVHPSTQPTGGAAPAIVYLHSGGWTSGTRASIPELVLAQADRGWVVVSADYRLAPDHAFPEADQDVDRVVRWVKANAPRLGVDPNRIVLAGGSAGGHLAAMAAAAPGRYQAFDLSETLARIDPRPAGLLALVAPTDLRALAGATSLGRTSVGALLRCPAPTTCDRGALATASVTAHVSPTAPPALFVFGALDTLVPAATHGPAVLAAWREAGATASQLVVAGSGHNLDPGPAERRVVEDFLDRTTAR